MITRDQSSADEGVRFLAEAGQALAASLDWEQTLMQVARLAVPALADWCIVDVLEDDGVTIKQVAVAAADPGKEDLLREMRMLYPPTIDSPQPAARSIRSGEPALFEEFGPAELDATTRDERHHDLIARLDPKSAVAVPLIARARTIGALTLAFSESGRRYGEAEIVLAMELAQRAALAVDNAILFSREREARAKAEEIADRLRDLEVISAAALTHLDLDRLLANLLDGVRTVHAHRHRASSCCSTSPATSSSPRGRAGSRRRSRPGSDPGRRRLCRARRRHALAGVHPGRRARGGRQPAADEARPESRCSACRCSSRAGCSV